MIIPRGGYGICAQHNLLLAAAMPGRSYEWNQAVGTKRLERLSIA